MGIHWLDLFLLMGLVLIATLIVLLCLPPIDEDEERSE